MVKRKKQNKDQDSNSADSSQKNNQAEEQLLYQAGLLQQVSEAIIATDFDLKITSWNDAATKIYGWCRDEALGRPVDDLLKTQWTGESQVKSLDILTDTGLWQGEIVQFHKDGQRLDILASVSFIRDPKGEIVGRVSVNRDITERKQMENALQLNEEILNATAGIAKVGGWEIDLKGNTLKWTQETFRIHELETGKAPHVDHAIKFYHPDDQPKVALAVENAIKNRKGFDFEARLITAKKNLRWVRAIGSVVERNQEAVGLQGMVQDITERKQAEEALKESEKELNRAQAITHIGSWSVNLIDGTFYHSDETKRIFGYEPSEYTLSVEDAINAYHPDDRADVIKYFNRAVETGEGYEFELRIIQPSGDIRNVFSQGFTEKDNNGKVTRVYGVFQDITERKQAENKLRESMERLKGFDQHSTEGVYRVDISKPAPIDLPRPELMDWVNKYAVVGEVNDSLARMYGLKPKDMIGRPAIEFAPNYGERAALVLERDGYRVVNEETEDLDKDGGKIYLIENYHGIIKDDCLVSIWGAQNNITQRKRAEEEREKLRIQLTQAQKMEAVGRLAGGVAHDFNNMLGVILGYAEMTLEEITPDHNFYSSLKEIKDAAQRSADLTRQLLAFARKQTVAPKVLDINQTIGGMTKMLGRLIGEDIDLAWRPGENLWLVRIDPAQVDQILANLCINARDAIAGQGKVTIETDKVSIDKAYCADHSGFVPGDYVILAVSDDGCGISAEYLDNIFEPFFTTKEQDEGTGLGLAMVYGVVKQNNGFINVYSEPGHGSTFKIYLPRHTARAAEAVEPKPRKAERGSETILLVEDESAILHMTTIMLEREGYTVVGAGTPGEAINLARKHQGKIDLLMSDVVMPEMNGRDLARNIMSLYPGIRKLFMSGYTANVIAHHGVLEEGVNFIQKPFSRVDLTVKVRKVLDGD